MDLEVSKRIKKNLLSLEKNTTNVILTTEALEEVVGKVDPYTMDL